MEKATLEALLVPPVLLVAVNEDITPASGTALEFPHSPLTPFLPRLVIFLPKLLLNQHHFRSTDSSGM